MNVPQMIAARHGKTMGARSCRSRGLGETRGRTSSSYNYALAWYFIISRNQDLIVLYPGAVGLVSHPFEEPIIGPSTLPSPRPPVPCWPDFLRAVRLVDWT